MKEFSNFLSMPKKILHFLHYEFDLFLWPNSIHIKKMKSFSIFLIIHWLEEFILEWNTKVLRDSFKHS